MSKTVKFASQIDETALSELREYAKVSDRSISGILNDAVVEYLAKVRLRPAFREAASAVMDENEELLRRLAR